MKNSRRIWRSSITALVLCGLYAVVSHIELWAQPCFPLEGRWEYRRVKENSEKGQVGYCDAAYDTLMVYGKENAPLYGTDSNGRKTTLLRAKNVEAIQYSALFKDGCSVSSVDPNHWLFDWYPKQSYQRQDTVFSCYCDGEYAIQTPENVLPQKLTVGSVLTHSRRKFVVLRRESVKVATTTWQDCFYAEAIGNENRANGKNKYKEGMWIKPGIGIVKRVCDEEFITKSDGSISVDYTCGELVRYVKP
jgi:hypothetical protein